MKPIRSPYTINTAPPEEIPVAKEDDIPSHELVNPKLMPNSDHHEKFVDKFVLWLFLTSISTSSFQNQCFLMVP
ncbi:unnamed protein product [Debaryomyces tyrocola]|nr:unnamed protein product [Debaryomyces tyrocola]